MPTLGLYLHFPWCVRKCPYCDFNSHPLKGSLDESGYLAALDADLEVTLEALEPGAVDSVFCGGGTPSLFSPGAFAQLLRRLEPWLAGDAEITLEANPGTVEHHDFAAYRRAGINRLSIGAQSFDADQLRRLGRIHGAEDSARAFRRARAGGFDNINIDLMYGLPGQTAGQASDDLEQALALEPEHLSWYQLTIEPKTEFARRPPLLPVDEELAAMERQGPERLRRAGYRRYEVSAFARDGRACRHNVNYWRFGDYLGAGAGAHGKRTRRQGRRLLIERTRKASQPRRYLQAPRETEVTAVAEDAVVFEFMLNALRLTHGVSFAEFEARTGRRRSDLLTLWQPLVDEGLVVADRIGATELGWRYLDSVLQRFLP